MISAKLIRLLFLSIVVSSTLTVSAQKESGNLSGRSHTPLIHSNISARQNWKGWYVNVFAGLIDGRLNKVSGESATRWNNDLNWQSQSLSEYSWGRGTEIADGPAVGVSLGYNWVLPANFTVGLQGGIAKTYLPFNLYGNKFSEDIPIRGTVEFVKNMNIGAVGDVNLRVGKIFGNRSRYHIYGKGGVSEAATRYYDRNDVKNSGYSPAAVNAGGRPAAVAYKTNFWNMGYNLGGGLEAAINSRASLGAEFLFTKYKDLNQTTGSLSQPYEHEIKTSQKLNTQIFKLQLNYRLGKDRKAARPAATAPVLAPVVETKAAYNLQVVAKDKLSGTILPNTDVVIKNDAGQYVKQAKTNNEGVVFIDNIVPGNYTIEGNYNGIELDGAVARTNDFLPNQTLVKEILYTKNSFLVKGKIFLCNTSTPVEDANVQVENAAKTFQRSTLTSGNGEFMIEVPETGTYKLYAKKNRLFSDVKEINTSNINRNKDIFINLEICAQETQVGKAIVLKNIFYDYDKSFIREDAKPDLYKLIQFMNDNPDVNVLLSSHTDSRGSDEYNRALSQRRAEAAVNFIVANGISKNRITAKGYGENRLVNGCANGVKCSEEEHQQNRRTEFEIVK